MSQITITGIKALEPVPGTTAASEAKTGLSVGGRPTEPTGLARDVEELWTGDAPGPLPSLDTPRPMCAGASLTVVSGARAREVVLVDRVPFTVGRAPVADLIVEDLGVSRHHVTLSRTVDGAFYAEDIASTNGTFLGSRRIGLALLQEGDCLRLGPVVELRFAILEPAQAPLEEERQPLAVLDPMTHVFNRAYLDVRLAAEIAHAQSAGDDVIVLMVDVDHLKRVNERFGRVVGDRALCAIVGGILRALSPRHVVARYDGDKVVALLLGTTVAQAVAVAARVQRGVQGLHLSARGRDVRLTACVSLVGLLEVDLTEKAGAPMLALAASRMRAAKAMGANRVCAFGPASL